MKRNANAVALTAIVITFATGCTTTFNLDAPAAVRQGAGIAVQMQGSPRIVRHSVEVDGQGPGTGTVPCSSDTRCSGVLPLPGVLPGDHVVTVTAELTTCWYCTPKFTTMSESRSFCVGDDPAAPTLNSMASTAAARKDGLLWSNTSDTGATTEMPTAGSATNHQWQFYRGGGLSAVGVHSERGE